MTFAQPAKIIIDEELEGSWGKALNGRTVKKILQDEQDLKVKLKTVTERVEASESESSEDYNAGLLIAAQNDAKDVIIESLKRTIQMLINDFQKSVETQYVNRARRAIEIDRAGETEEGNS